MSKIEHYSNHNKGLPKRGDDFGWEIARYNSYHKIYNVSLKVKYCEVCDICWEYERYGDTTKYSKILKYRDFPRNGLKRQVCISCKDKYLVDFSDCKLCGSELGLRRENSTIFLCDDCEAILGTEIPDTGEWTDSRVRQKVRKRVLENKPRSIICQKKR